MNTLYAHFMNILCKSRSLFFPPKKKQMNQITDPAQIEIFLLTSAIAVQYLF